MVVHIGLQKRVPLLLQTEEGGLVCSTDMHTKNWSVCLYLHEHRGTARVHSWMGGGGCSGGQ